MKHALMVLLLLAGPVLGQTVKLPAEVKVGVGRLATISVSWDGSDVKWSVPSALDVFREYDPDPRVIRLRVIGYEDGEHRILAVAAKDGKLSEFAACVVTVGKVVPPGPKPDPAPKPPDPPAPDVAPIPVAGFRVMIIEDKEKLSLLPAAQLSIRTSKVFRDYLDANCVTEPDGKTKAYRIWDHKTNAVADLKLWQDALARLRAHSYTDASGKAVHVTNYTPWLIVSDFPRGGYEGPLPANTDDAIQLLKKVKGN